MSIRSALACIIALAPVACAYSQSYRQTNFDLQPAPVAAESVQVIKNRDNLSQPTVDLGTFVARAETVNEAMDAAKAMCGDKGAELYILNVEPYESMGSWKIDGACAVYTQE